MSFEGQKWVKRVKKAKNVIPRHFAMGRFVELEKKPTRMLDLV